METDWVIGAGSTIIQVASRALVYYTGVALHFCYEWFTLGAEKKRGAGGAHQQKDLLQEVYHYGWDCGTWSIIKLASKKWETLSPQRGTSQKTNMMLDGLVFSWMWCKMKTDIKPKSFGEESLKGKKRTLGLLTTSFREFHNFLIYSSDGYFVFNSVKFIVGGTIAPSWGKEGYQAPHLIQANVLSQRISAAQVMLT